MLGGGAEEGAAEGRRPPACDLPVAAANGFLPGSLKSTGPEANHEGVLAFAETAFKRASRVGIRHIVFGSSGSRRVPDGFDHGKAQLQFVALLARMAPLAKANDVTVVVEPLNTGEVRLDAPLDPDGDRALIERFIAEDLPDTEEKTMERFLSDEVEDALKALPARDAKVLKLYFGLDGGREHTLEEIGGMLGVTRERVRQLRDRALKRLREGDVGRALASFAA